MVKQTNKYINKIPPPKKTGKAETYHYNKIDMVRLKLMCLILYLEKILDSETSMYETLTSKPD